MSPDPHRPIIIEGPYNCTDRVRWTKLLRWDGSTFSVTARRFVQARSGEHPIEIEELDPPSGARRVMFIRKAAEREWHESLDQLEETA